MGVMSILRKIFGGSPKDIEGNSETSLTETYKEYQIRATPYKEAGQFQMCGIISREIDGARKEHRFVRADRFSSAEEAATFTIQKARQIIDLNGDRMFSGS